jgi:hypothetical protein
VNCGKEHAANYGGCKRMKLEKKVEEIRAHRDITYREALKITKEMDKENDENNNEIQTTQQQRPANTIIARTQQNRQTFNLENEHFPGLPIRTNPFDYNPRTKQRPQRILGKPPSQASTEITRPDMQDAGTQTKADSSTQTQETQQPSAPRQPENEISGEPFLAFILELLVTTSQSIDLGQKCQITTNTYRKHFGKIVDPAKLKQMVIHKDNSHSNKQPVASVNSVTPQARSGTKGTTTNHLLDLLPTGVSTSRNVSK